MLFSIRTIKKKAYERTHSTQIDLHMYNMYACAYRTRRPVLEKKEQVSVILRELSHIKSSKFC